MMESLTKKALSHVIEILEDFDTYKVYSNLHDSLKKSGIDDVIMQKILSTHQQSIHIQSIKVKEAKDWVSEILNSIK